MNICVICASPIANEETLCSAHPLMHDHEWATANRQMCDFIHRGKVPPPGAREAWEDELHVSEVRELAVV